MVPKFQNKKRRGSPVSHSCRHPAQTKDPGTTSTRPESTACKPPAPSSHAPAYNPAQPFPASSPMQYSPFCFGCSGRDRPCPPSWASVSHPSGDRHDGGLRTDALQPCWFPPRNLTMRPCVLPLFQRHDTCPPTEPRRRRLQAAAAANMLRTDAVPAAPHGAVWQPPQTTESQLEWADRSPSPGVRIAHPGDPAGAHDASADEAGPTPAETDGNAGGFDPRCHAEPE